MATTSRRGFIGPAPGLLASRRGAGRPDCHCNDQPVRSQERACHRWNRRPRLPGRPHQQWTAVRQHIQRRSRSGGRNAGVTASFGLGRNALPTPPSPPPKVGQRSAYAMAPATTSVPTSKAPGKCWSDGPGLQGARVESQSGRPREPTAGYLADFAAWHDPFGPVSTCEAPPNHWHSGRLVGGE